MEGNRRRWTAAAVLAGLALAAAPSGALAKPRLRIDDAPKVTEPATGTTPQKFKVSIDRRVGHAVTFDFQTYDGTASTLESDYADSAGAGKIAAGKRSTKVVVQVAHDAIPEPTEAYGVAISNVHRARLTAHRNASGFIKDGNHHESEPNNVFVRANPVSEFDSLGAHFSLSDTDFFTYTATFTGAEAVYTGPYGDFTCAPGAGQIDTLITVYNAAHVQIAQNDDQGAGNLCSLTSFSSQMGQTYYVAVTDGAGGGSIFGYTLTFTSI